MYCPVTDSDSDRCSCTSRCCTLYNAAIAFLGAILFFVLGVIFALLEGDLVAGALSLFVVSFVIILIVLIVTMLTKGCCRSSSRE